MFTGLVETIGSVTAVSQRKGAARIGISSDLPATEMVLGESVAVDGVCLTVSSLGGQVFEADAVQETLDRSTLARLRPGDRVNLERALRLGDRLGGHLVQGHIDGTAGVSAVIRQGGDCRIRVDMPRELARYLAPKGSVALHGVSLTIARVDEGSFEVAIIPETLDRTTLGVLRAGDTVNVEVDVVARYLDSLIGGEKTGRGQGGGMIHGLPTMKGKARDR